MRKRIFRRIFLVYVGVLLLAMAFGKIYITTAVRDNYLDNLQEHLAHEINLIAKTVPFETASG